MRINIAGILFFILITMMLDAAAYPEDIQPACLNGTFYPDDKTALEEMIGGFMQAASTGGDIPEDIIAVISPHAGYRYSGAVAAFGFKALKDRGFNTVIIVAPSHRHYFKGVAVLDKDAYATPIGNVYIDKALAKELVAYDDIINYHQQPFFNENSTETQIPFIRHALPDARIVVVLIGDPSYDTCLILGEALYKAINTRRDVVIISSTDMSHFSPEKRARSIDKAVMDKIKQFDPWDLYAYLSTMRDKDRPCGTPAVISTLIAAKRLGADRIDILRYATSADTSGDNSSVVGYMSAVVLRSNKGLPDNDNRARQTGDNMKNLLDMPQKNRLLKIARHAIEGYIMTGRRPDVEEQDKTLNREMGAFVTLHKQGRLRGCIGNIIGKGPLYSTVSDMAIESATGDPRFSPVTRDEIDDIDIEISVLSPLEEIDDADKIIMGRHGVLVKSGFKSGVYLPQVATETGWGRDEFMDSLCAQKAGIPKDSWRTGACQIYIFSAEVFGEKR
jgi:MEMO1 family protein